MYYNCIVRNVLQPKLGLQESIVVILDHGKCANNRTTDEQNVETRYPGFILWVSNHVRIVFRRIPLWHVGTLYVNRLLINYNNIIVWCFLIEMVKIAGYFAIAGTLSLAVFCILSIVQLAMVVSKEKVVVAYSKTVASKLVFAFAASKYIVHMYPRYILKNNLYTIPWQTYYARTRMKFLTR